MRPRVQFTCSEAALLFALCIARFRKWHSDSFRLLGAVRGFVTFPSHSRKKKKFPGPAVQISDGVDETRAFFFFFVFFFFALSRGSVSAIGRAPGRINN